VALTLLEARADLFRQFRRLLGKRPAHLVPRAEAARPPADVDRAGARLEQLDRAGLQVGMNAAVQGDVVAVLPGIYNENVSLKSLVRLVSADQSSTNTNRVQGNPLTTIIRAPSGLVAGATNTTVSAANT